eukprot:CAMPEP_0201637030 /NCGR_PEP_ID=MMETSP0493-20130528/10982_1 /ASSEMBLY_ACC=CAM_ASM_000838 /TAXON_ID=420259 /ORGANISM="Thalassiosira gravida, Strain GMp14c1" /LENGTH=91 /DNA_ID=CAMNT_0048109393 /DNA_START=4 /DNA_END=276 /DNA_ORIENTATION=+
MTVLGLAHRHRIGKCTIILLQAEVSLVHRLVLGLRAPAGEFGGVGGGNEEGGEGDGDGEDFIVLVLFVDRKVNEVFFVLFYETIAWVNEVR